MFNIDNNINVTVSGSKFLTGDAIHEVTFNSIEKAEVGTYQVLELRFSNDDGEFVERFFEPRPEDAARKQNTFGGDNPSGVEQLLGKMRSYIAALNPELNDAIEKGTKKFQAKNWDELRSAMIAAVGKKVNTKTMIKLISVKNKNGYTNAVTPAFPMAISKEGRMYLQSAFVGEKASFNKKELKDIEARKSAPTPMAGGSDATSSSAPTTTAKKDEFENFDFDELG